MRFFNLDLHVSVIEDVATSLGQLGHDVDSHLMSGHSWALDKLRASSGTGPGVEGKVGYKSVNLTSWESMWWAPNDTDAILKVGRTFRDEAPELDAYDGFIACYPASFALLYEKFRGHIVVNAPVRYEYPFAARPDLWQTYNDFLVRGVEEGRVTVVANSKYDALYYEYFTGRPATHISSTCEYIDRMAKKKWSPTGSKLLGFGEHAGCRKMQDEAGVPWVRNVKLLVQYDHAQLTMARGIVWIPYNCSIMSFFEHYWLNIPLFVPTQRFLLELHHGGMALSQLSFHADPTGGSGMPRRGTSMPDPNTPDGLRAWMDTYDFYNAQEFPHVTYFDSWTELREKIASVDFEAVSARMAEHNEQRKARNLRAWESVMARAALRPA